MEKEAKAWVIGPVVGAAALGIAGMLYDLNTTDDEVMPILIQLDERSTLLEKVAAQQAGISAQNSDSLHSLAVSRAQSSMTVGIKDIARLDLKYMNVPRGQWAEADKKLYAAAEERIATATVKLNRR